MPISQILEMITDLPPISTLAYPSSGDIYKANKLERRPAMIGDLLVDDSLGLTTGFAEYFNVAGRIIQRDGERYQALADNTVLAVIRPEVVCTPRMLRIVKNAFPKELTLSFVGKRGPETMCATLPSIGFLQYGTLANVLLHGFDPVGEAFYEVTRQRSF
jgi:hypothetical protein